MISVASGVTVGLFVSQVIGEFLRLIEHPGNSSLVYLFGTRKNAAHFAF